MAKFKVRIYVELTRDLDVEAKNEDAAKRKAYRMWYNGDVNYDSFDCREIETYCVDDVIQTTDVKES